jgi:hypothetical protein
VPLAKDALQHLFTNLLALPHSIVLHAGLSKLLVFFTQPPDTGVTGRNTWIEKEASNSDGQGDDAIDDENPPPLDSDVRGLC